MIHVISSNTPVRTTSSWVCHILGVSSNEGWLQSELTTSLNLTSNSKSILKQSRVYWSMGTEMMATQSNEIKNIQNLELKTLSDLHTFISEGPCCKKIFQSFRLCFLSSTHGQWWLYAVTYYQYKDLLSSLALLWSDEGMQLFCDKIFYCQSRNHRINRRNIPNYY